MDRTSLVSKMLTFKKLVFFFCLLNVTNGANILFFFGVSTYSHRIVIWPLVEELAAKGHKVTFFSPFTPKTPNPNVTEVHPKDLQDFFSNTFGSGSNLIQRRIDGNHRNMWNELVGLGQVVCDVICKSQETLNWIDSTYFDLVVIDGLFNECGLGIAYKFGAPHIIFDTSSVFMWQYDVYGMPAETSWIPDMSLNWPQQMNFYQRVSNTLRPLYWYFVRHYSLYPKLEEVLRNSLNISDMPPLKELERQTSAVLINTHYSIEFARSLPPLFIPVAGMHCKEISPATRNRIIPKNILKFIDESENGFVYVSFGGAVQISKMKLNFQQLFFAAFGNVSTRFVWKWEGDRPKEMPENVITAAWMPQQTILAHPNIRAFITHGGLLGMEEAIYNAVPLVVLPVFAEQDYNAERVDRDGYGRKLEVTTITQSILQDSITQVITNKRYKTRMSEVSRIFRDRITEPLQTAVWWTEFVLRNKDTPSFLRPLSAAQTWYQRRLLDVWLFLLIVTVTTFTCAILIGKLAVKIMLSKFPIHHFRKTIGERLTNNFVCNEPNNNCSSKKVQ